jgi:hypothetical protein
MGKRTGDGTAPLTTNALLGLAPIIVDEIFVFLERLTTGLRSAHQ